MKRIILAAALSLMFTAPVNALSSTDVLLSCWTDGSDSESGDNATTVILNIGSNTVEMIDPHNRVQKGDLTVAEYFYTITIPKNTQFSKTGKIKINRFTGRLSTYWEYFDSKDGSVLKAENVYGFCITLSNNGYRF